MVSSSLLIMNNLWVTQAVIEMYHLVTHLEIIKTMTFQVTFYLSVCRANIVHP